MNSSNVKPILYTGTLLMLVAACSGVVEAPDEGAGGSTEVAVCSSNTFWKDQDMPKASEAMNPGLACNTCHLKIKTAPLYTVSGTVYPTLKEPDNCNGANGGMSNMPDISIVVTDNTGKTQPAIPVNSVGNFLTVANVIKPFWVKVVNNKTKAEKKMMAQTDNGDCNSCHTQNGAQGATGRVTVP